MPKSTPASPISRHWKCPPDFDCSQATIVNLQIETRRSRPEKEKRCLMCLTERGPRPVDRANTPAASPPPLLPRSRKALRASAGACNVLPAGARPQPLSFIVIGCRFFCSPCRQSPRQSGHWGRCPVRTDFRCDPAHMKQTAPGAACWKKKTNKSGCAGQISPGEFFASALRTFGWLVASAHRPQAPAKRLKTAG